MRIEMDFDSLEVILTANSEELDSLGDLLKVKAKMKDNLTSICKTAGRAKLVIEYKGE